jgi:hypothetical protein
MAPGEILDHIFRNRLSKSNKVESNQLCDSAFCFSILLVAGLKYNFKIRLKDTPKNQIVPSTIKARAPVCDTTPVAFSSGNLYLNSIKQAKYPAAE